MFEFDSIKLDEKEQSSIERRFLKASIFTACIAMLVLVYIAITSEEVKDSQVHTLYEPNEKKMINNRLYEYLGYGGVIHNFYNYLLRGEQHYFSNTLEKIGGLKFLIKQYRSMSPSILEDKALLQLESGLQQYTNSILKIKQLKDQGKSVAEIVKLIDFDKTLVSSALRNFEVENNVSAEDDAEVVKLFHET